MVSTVIPGGVVLSGLAAVNLFACHFFTTPQIAPLIDDALIAFEELPPEVPDTRTTTDYVVAERFGATLSTFQRWWAYIFRYYPRHAAFDYRITSALSIYPDQYFNKYGFKRFTVLACDPSHVEALCKQYSGANTHNVHLLSWLTSYGTSTLDMDSGDASNTAQVALQVLHRRTEEHASV